MGNKEIIAVVGEYKKQFAEKYGIIALGVFGSVARDDMSNESDVDICVKTVTPDPFVLVHIKEDLEQRVHRRVDIVRIREKMNPFLKNRIEKEGVYV